jgi:hypothetical protein
MVGFSSSMFETYAVHNGFTSRLGRVRSSERLFSRIYKADL